MNTNLTIRTEATLQDTKFADLATIYNEFATELDIKPIKKFRDKPTGIKRVLEIQAKYSEALPEQAKPEAKDPVQEYIDNGGEVEQCPPQKTLSQRHLLLKVLSSLKSQPVQAVSASQPIHSQ